MTSLKCFASLILATTMVTALGAETRCPGNVASLPFRLVNRYQMIVAVSVNRSGPYAFLLDTGMQITAVDPSVAAKLHLKPRGVAVVAGAGSRESASYAQVDLLEAGSQAVSNQRVLVYDLQNLHIQGILGEDFLEHFDLLIDNVHNLLCLDSTSAMRAKMRGPHTTLVTPAEVADGSQPSSLPIVEARLSNATRPVRLVLDSGANDLVLYNTSEYLPPQRLGQLQGTGVNGRQMIFSAVPPQDVKIGSLALTGVSFYSLGGNQKDARAKGIDGVLTLGVFRRVFIAPADHFAILEPRYQMAQILDLADLSNMGAAETFKRTEPDQLRILIRVYDFAHVDRDVLQSGEKLTTGILHKAGIEVVWLDRLTAPPSNAEVVGPEFRLNIVPRLEMLSTAQAKSKDDLLGFAIPCGETDQACLFYVLYSRISAWAGRDGTDPSRIIGHVMAHEIGMPCWGLTRMRRLG